VPLDSEPFETAHLLKMAMRSRNRGDAVFLAQKPYLIRQRLRECCPLLDRSSLRSLSERRILTSRRG